MYDEEEKGGRVVMNPYVDISTGGSAVDWQSMDSTCAVRT